MRSVSSSKIERWLGAEMCANLSQRMRGWYGTPVCVAGVPGAVYADAQGDFVGHIAAGSEGSLEQALEDMATVHRTRRMGWARKQGGGFNTVAAVKAAKVQHFQALKPGTVTVSGAVESLFRLGTQPPAGGSAAAAPGGTAPNATSTGAYVLDTPGAGRTLHFLGGHATNASGGNAMLLYDRIFAVNKTMNSTATEAVTGVPTRYQSTTSGAHDSAENNFMFPEVGNTALAATAHNWSTCLYTNQAGTTSRTAPSATGVSGAAIARVDLASSQWFMPLQAGDSGVQALTQMQCSAAVATGEINFVMGHPIAILPCIASNFKFDQWGINSSFNFARIQDSACLAFIAFLAAGSAATWRSNFFLVEG